LAGPRQRRNPFEVTIRFVPVSAPPHRLEADWAEDCDKIILRRCPVCEQESIIGHGRRRKQAHDEHHDWIGVRRGRCAVCGRHSHSCHCSLCLIRITACRRAAMHCSGVLRSSAHGRRHYPSSRTLIVCPIRRRCGAGQVGWTVSSWLFPFSTWPLFVQPIGWLASIRLLTTLGHRRG
jgi:hypothetical protein